MKIFVFSWLIFVVFAAAGCANRPGEGALAEKCFATFQPVVTALERYKQERGNYPSTTGEMIPQYLERYPTPFEVTQQQKIPLFYESSANGYLLKFEYLDSGTNRCRYTSTQGKWECDGYQ